jgi:hypothetical protein
MIKLIKTYLEENGYKIHHQPNSHLNNVLSTYISQLPLTIATLHLVNTTLHITHPRHQPTQLHLENPDFFEQLLHTLKNL